MSTSKDYIASVHDIFNAAQNDPTLKSQINVAEILQNTRTDSVKSLETVTQEVLNELKDVYEQNHNSCGSLTLSERNDAIKEMYAKLKEYRVINEVFEIHRGKHVRWIRRQAKTVQLTAGGIVMEIKFFDTGTHILVKCGGSRFIQIKYDDCAIFQKLSDEEQIVMTHAN